MERDERVMVLGEDVGKKGGVFGATEGLWAKYGDKRVLDTPLTEGMIAGAAMGAAVYGLRPIAEMQFADFVYPAFNQIVSEISRIHYRSNGTFTRADGDPHAVRRRRPRRALPLQSNEAYFTSTVGLKVVAPGTPADAKGLLKAADPRPRPGHVLRAQEDVPAVQGRGARRRHGRAHRQGVGRPRGQAPVDLLLRLHAHLRARGGRDAGARGRRRGRGRRPAHAAPARPRDDPGLGREDRQGARRARGQPLRRLRRRDRGRDQREGLRAPRRPGHPAGRPGGARACRTTTPSRTGS